MNHLQLEDLRVADSLERDDCLAVRGGDAGVGQGAETGGVGSDVALTTSGFAFASPVILLNFVMPINTTTQTGIAVDTTTVTSTINSVGSMLEGVGIEV